MTATEIQDCFAAAGSEYAQALMDAYNVDTGRPTQTKLGALDFLNDVRFALPCHQIATRWNRQNKAVFRYLVDESNPWQSSSRAHHAVDLIYIFGGVHLAEEATQRPNVEGIGQRIRHFWILFAYGEEPWPLRKHYAFGPLGRSDILSDSEYAQRRRLKCIELLGQLPGEVVNVVYGKLATGRIGLLN